MTSRIEPATFLLSPLATALVGNLAYEHKVRLRHEDARNIVAQVAGLSAWNDVRALDAHRAGHVVARLEEKTPVTALRSKVLAQCGVVIDDSFAMRILDPIIPDGPSKSAMGMFSVFDASDFRGLVLLGAGCHEHQQAVDFKDELELTRDRRSTNACCWESRSPGIQGLPRAFIEIGTHARLLIPEAFDERADYSGFVPFLSYGGYRYQYSVDPTYLHGGWTENYLVVCGNGAGAELVGNLVGWLRAGELDVSGVTVAMGESLVLRRGGVFVGHKAALADTGPATQFLARDAAGGATTLLSTPREVSLARARDGQAWIA